MSAGRTSVNRELPTGPGEKMDQSSEKYTGVMTLYLVLAFYPDLPGDFDSPGQR